MLSTFSAFKQIFLVGISGTALLVQKRKYIKEINYTTFGYHIMALRPISFIGNQFLYFSRGLRQQNTSTIISNDKWLHFWFHYMFRSIDHTNKNLCFLHRKSFKNVFPENICLTRCSANLFFMKLNFFGNGTKLTTDRKMNRNIHESTSIIHASPKNIFKKELLQL